jgi:tripartite-type tricarboxylate transporter receptor subunit TctC
MTKVSQWPVARYLLSRFCVLMVPTIINSAETQHSFQLLGITPVSESPDELVARISSDFQKWKEAVANVNGNN